MTGLYGHKWVSVYGVVSYDDGRLTDTAKMWVTELAGVSYEQIATGISKLGAVYQDWPPTVFKFRELCLMGYSAAAPSIEEIVRILTTLAPPAPGRSIADRFKHPLALAVSKKIDMFALRTAKHSEAVKIIAPVYLDLKASNWQEFDEYETFRGEVMQIPRLANKTAGKAFLSEIKAIVKFG